MLATFSNEGELQNTHKFPTPKSYKDFLTDLKSAVANLTTDNISRVAVAVPGVVDREKGRLVSLGNLTWANEPIAADIERLTHAPVMVENDAKLAGLSEARLAGENVKKVLYVTISTGIGIALINDGVIDDALGDTGGHDMYVEFGGKRITWEKLTSGKSIVATYGKRASEIDDPRIWEVISKKIAVGLIDLIALFQPNIIVVGGGVGSHFKKYDKQLLAALQSYETPMTKLPKIVQAQNPEEAVIYGCYELAKQHNK